MSNHLNEFLECLKLDRVVDSHTAERLDECFRHDCEKLGSISECFYMGDSDAVCSMPSGIMDLVEIPYPYCWIEMTTLDGIVAFMVRRHEEQEPNTQSKFRMFVVQRRAELKHQNIWEFVNNCTVAIQNGKGKIWQDHKDQKDMEFMEVAAGSLMNFLCCINCSNVKRLKNPPNFTQCRQIRKAGGNPSYPKYTYWTLHLKQKEGEPTEAKAGHGRKPGPRLHLRRGHFRRLQSGKFVWVNSCVVGNAEKGIALKDYSIH